MNAIARTITVTVNEITANVEVTLSSSYRDDSFGYSYGSENGTHECGEWEFELDEYTFEGEDENGDKVTLPEGKATVEAMEKAVDALVKTDYRALAAEANEIAAEYAY